MGRAYDVSRLPMFWHANMPSLLAQLFPATRSEAVPPGATRDGAAEGANPDLGPRGTYASLGWEDLEALLPWLTLQGSGQLNEPRRSGMGFEPGGDL